MAFLPMICGGGGGRRSKAALSPKVVRRPPLPPKPSTSSCSAEQKVEFLRNGSSSAGAESGNDESFRKEDDERGSKDKVMVVVDSSVEAKSALEWAISHAVESQESIIFLLYVCNQHQHQHQSDDEALKLKRIKAYEILYTLKNFCERTKPGVEVELVIREGKNRGAVIVEEAKRQRVSLLVLGQRKRCLSWRIMWRLKTVFRRKSHGGDGDAEAAVKYCIQNAACMALAVRRKGRKLGGYLITTKCRKNFWLLA